MARTKISEFSSNPATNTDIDSIFIGEGMAPSNVNDAIRELMAQLKDFQTGAVGDSFNGPIGTTTAAAGAFTTLSASSTLGVTGVSTLTGGAFVQGLTVGRGAGAVATNTAVGTNALASNSAGTDVTAIGNEAYRYGTAVNNTALGSKALGSAVVTGTENTSIGRASLFVNTSGSNNVAVGSLSLFSNTTASNNTAVGYQAGYSNTTGNIVALGKGTLYNNTTGIRNVAVGTNAAIGNTTSNSNIAIGYDALFTNSTGASNTAIGDAALQANTTASNNTAVGYQAGYTNVTGDNNTYIGRRAGYNATGTLNTFVGAVNCGDLVTTGAKNTIIGGYNGNQGGLDIRTANNYIVLSDGDGNPRGIFDGSGNLMVGTTSSSLSNSNSIIVVPSFGGFQQQHSSGTGSGTSYTNFIYNAGVIGSITQSGTTAVLYNTTSDQRLKENIFDAPEFGSVIDSIKVRSFDWKSDNSHQRAGFVAQELVTVAPEAVHQPEDSEQMMAVDYSKLVPMLVKEIQSLRVRVAQLESN